MEVKEIKKMDHIPNVFLTSDLVKFSLVDNFINCVRYKSRSGSTQSGCFKIVMPNLDNFKIVRGMYYVNIPSVLQLQFRRKYIRDESDVIAVLKSINLDDTLRNMGIYQNDLLIAWDNYVVSVYDHYKKARIYEFPLLNRQGNLAIYEIPPKKGAYLTIHDDNGERTEINKDLFEEIKDFYVYNHHVTFDNPVLRLKEVYVYGGHGAILYIPQGVNVKVESPDHPVVEFYICKDKWVIFSHPPPRKVSD